MKKIFLFLFINFLFANPTDSDIANSLKNASNKYGIDKRILYTLAKIESGFKPNIIAFLSDKKIKIHSNQKIIINNIPYESKYLIQIIADKNTLKKIAKQLINNKFSIDMGLMQINSINVSLEELEYIFDLDFNISKSISILELCVDRKKSLKKSIECYNKGFRKIKNFNYYEKFKNSFLKDWSNI